MSGNILPSAELAEAAPAGQLVQQAPADIPVLIGCAESGGLQTIESFGSQDIAGMAAVYVCGPLLAEGTYNASKLPVPFVLVRVPATQQAAQCSVVNVAGISGTAVLGTPAIGSMKDGWDVVVLVTAGGTIGTSYTYEVSLDGGQTFGAPIAVTTSLSMAITGAWQGQTVATGITIALTSGQTFVTSDTFNFWTEPASASLLTTFIARVSGSTSTLVFSGTPANAYQIVVQFLSSGTEGVQGALQFWVSLDGALTFGLVQTLAMSGVYLIPDGAGSSGVTLTVGAGTITALDQVTINTTAPVPAFSDVQLAMDAVRNWAGTWSFFVLCGYSTRAMRDSIEAHVQTYAASGRYTFCVVSMRDRITGETTGSPGNVTGDLAWSNRLFAEWASSVGNRTPACAGSARVTSPLPGTWQNRRTTALGYTGRTIGISPDTDQGDRSVGSGGALSSDTSITTATGQLAEHDARLNPILYGLGACVVRTYYGETGIQPGVFPAGGLLIAAATDIQRWAYRRVLNLADAAFFTAMQANLLTLLPVWPATVRTPYVGGDIQVMTLNALTGKLFYPVRSAVGPYVASGNQANRQGGITVTINPTPVVVAGSATVYADCQVTLKEILVSFVGTIGPVNPALAPTSTGP